MFKQLNPWNRLINETNREKFVQIDEIPAVVDREVAAIYSKIFTNTTNENTTTKPVRKFYLAMEFNQINNPEFQDERLYSLGMFGQFNRTPLYTPQINNISMVMPSQPALYEWNQIPQVNL